MARDSDPGSADTGGEGYGSFSPARAGLKIGPWRVAGRRRCCRIHCRNAWSI